MSAEPHVNLPPALAWSATTDLGQRRSNNEDCWGAWSLDDHARPLEPGTIDVPAGGVLLAVSDGMGGAEGGEIASRFCLTELAVRLAPLAGTVHPPATLAGVFREVHAALLALAESRPGLHGMGATLSALWLRPAGTSAFGHVGDSRIYHRNAGGWRQLTEDQSVGAGLVRRGEMSEQDVRRLRYRSMLEQVMGGDGSPLEPQVLGLEWSAESRFALCSDGLYGPVGSRLPGELETATAGDLGAGVRRLVQTANTAGGPDNITVILARSVPNRPA